MLSISSKIINIAIIQQISCNPLLGRAILSRDINLQYIYKNIRGVDTIRNRLLNDRDKMLGKRLQYFVCFIGVALSKYIVTVILRYRMIIKQDTLFWNMLLFVFALFIGLFYEIECRPTESIDTEIIFARCGDKKTLQCLTEVCSKIHFIFYFKFLFFRGRSFIQ